MSFKCGIVGLPNVGKSTLFNALTNSSKAQAANFPFCTIDPNVGIVPVPDERSVSYTHLRAHETLRYLVCRLLLEKKLDLFSSTVNNK